MPRTIAFFWLLITFASAATAQHANIRGPADDPTPQVRILSPADRATVKRNQPFTVRIETRDFKFLYDAATTPGGPDRLPDKYNQVVQEPNAGHVHVYIAALGRAGEYKNFIMPQNFVMPNKFVMPNRGEFEFPGLPAGRYKLLVELVSHDHTPRVKRHPRDWPSLDIIVIDVR
jgi:hypothetical protein